MIQLIYQIFHTDIHHWPSIGQTSAHFVTFLRMYVWMNVKDTEYELKRIEILVPFWFEVLLFMPKQVFDFALYSKFSFHMKNQIKPINVSINLSAFQFRQPSLTFHSLILLNILFLSDWTKSTKENNSFLRRLIFITSLAFSFLSEGL